MRLALNPSDAVAEYEVGPILQAGQKATPAAGRFEKAAALDPSFAEALIAMAKTKSDAKKYSDAIPLLGRAVKLQPAGESAHYRLMLAYRNAGTMEEAQREKAVFASPTPSPEGEFTEFLRKLGDKAKQ